jgi:hypothetical protein
MIDVVGYAVTLDLSRHDGTFRSISSVSFRRTGERHGPGTAPGEYNGAAMENFGCVTLSEELFLYRSQVTDFEYEKRANHIQHELAFLDEISTRGRVYCGR